MFPDAGEFPAHEPVRAARELRRAWRLPIGRVDDLTAAIESAAGLVLYVDFGADEATAAFISTPGDERMWFLLNSREQAGEDYDELRPRARPCRTASPAADL